MPSNMHEPTKVYAPQPAPPFIWHAQLSHLISLCSNGRKCTMSYIYMYINKRSISWLLKTTIIHLCFKKHYSSYQNLIHLSITLQCHVYTILKFNVKYKTCCQNDEEQKRKTTCNNVTTVQLTVDMNIKPQTKP